MTISDAIKFKYGADLDSFDVSEQLVMIEYDPQLHPWITPGPDAPETIPDPNGQTETVITRWDLTDPQPTIQELKEYAASPEFAAAQLAEAKAAAIEQTQQQAEATRANYITTRPGKIGEYTQKRTEFTAWRAAGSPDPAPAGAYPIAEAEAVSYGISTTGMLQIWEDRAAAWSAASAAIAAAERKALLAIEAATTVEEIEAALAAIEWPG